MTEEEKRKWRRRTVTDKKSLPGRSSKRVNYLRGTEKHTGKVTSHYEGSRIAAGGKPKSPVKKSESVVKRLTGQWKKSAGLTWDILTRKDQKYLVNKYGPQPKPSKTKRVTTAAGRRKNVPRKKGPAGR